MKKVVASALIFSGMLVSACERQDTVTAPSAAVPTASSPVHANLTAPTVSDACKPPASSVVFDATQLGHVTITNNSSCTNEFLYIVWSVPPGNEANQTQVAAIGARLSPGEHRDLTVGFTVQCGSRYQRDVYIGISDGSQTYTLSDVRNYFFAALGYFQLAPSCPPPPPPPTPTPTPPAPPVPPVTHTNRALNQPTVASSLETSLLAASNAVDGNLSTRWSSQFSDPQWIYVDLGQIYTISEVVLRWETAYGKNYQVQVSNDALTWTTIRTVTGGVGGVDDLTGLSGSGRYVRMLGTARGTIWGYSLFELEVY